jgi:anthranilate/para-aminobenzoate synthase component II
MILVVDNTADQSIAMYLPKLLSYLRQRGYQYRVVRSIDDMKHIMNVQGIILSGSPIMVTEKDFIDNNDVFFTNVHAIHVKHGVPILGICFGCQFLNVLWGGDLHKLRSTLCKTVPVEFCQEKIMGTKIPASPHEFQFCCRYTPNKIPHQFRALAHMTREGKQYPCMIRHKRLPIFGTLFHPEYHADTHWVLDAFMKQCKL